MFIVFIIKNNDFNITLIDNVSKSFNYYPNYKEQTKCDEYLRLRTVLSVLNKKTLLSTVYLMKENKLRPRECS